MYISWKKIKLLEIKILCDIFNVMKTKSIERLQLEIRRLKRENVSLKKENNSLNLEVKELQSDLRDCNQKLTEALSDLN